MNAKLLTVSTSPHWLGRTTIRSMHVEFMAALLPAVFTGFYYFGFPGLSVVVLAMASALITEVICVRVTNLPNRVEDLHAVLLGLLLGLILPAGAPWWLPIVGGALAIILGKMVFGGLGNYPMHPVLVAWVALSLSWPEHMNAYYAPVALGSGGDFSVTETPLMALKNDIGSLEIFELADLWVGNAPGAIGATGSLALIAGGIYLMLRRLVPWQIPVGVILGAVLMSIVAAYTDARIMELGMEGLAANLKVAWFHLATGGLLIAAFFLAPEPVSSPVTPWGTFLFGLGVGVMTIIVRTWGSWPDGAFYGVLLMNTVTPLLDRIRPKVLGKVVGGNA
ncbi:MAG: RnfABCDGE type electron transport complex subunit D [Pseudomonadota bacterium]